MSATAIPTKITLADYTVTTLILPTIDPRETELIFIEKSQKGGMWTAFNAMALDLTQVPTEELKELDYERLRRQAASYGIVLAGVVSEKDKERVELMLKGRARFIAPRVGGKADQKNKTTPNNTTKAALEPNSNESKTNENGVHKTNTQDTINAESVSTLDEHASLIHYGNVRSGAQIYAQNKSLIIFGNVGDGAEVISDDCIFIFGKALGRVLAGAKNPNSIVFCKNFNPQLISINGVYCTADDISAQNVDKTVLVKLRDGKLDFEEQNK